MAKVKPTWREKLGRYEEKIHKITPEWEAKLGKGKILIPSPLAIEKLVKRTKSGQLLTNDTIRERLAKDKKVRLTAAAPTGIYLKMIALTSEEETAANKAKVTPYWRVLKPDGTINIKFPGGVEQQVALLEAEGHTIEPGKGKRPPRVQGFEKKLKSL